MLANSRTIFFKGKDMKLGNNLHLKDSIAKEKGILEGLNGRLIKMIANIKANSMTNRCFKEKGR